MNLSISEQANAVYLLRKSVQIDLASLLLNAPHDTDLDRVEAAYARFKEIFIEEKRLIAERNNGAK